MIILPLRCLCPDLRVPLEYSFRLTKRGSHLSGGERKGGKALEAAITSIICGISGLFIANVQTCAQTPDFPSCGQCQDTDKRVHSIKGRKEAADRQGHT